MDLITKSFNRARDPPLVRNWWLNFIFDTWAGMENAAYPYSSASLFLDGRPFRVVASLRRIFQQLDARRTVRQVYSGGRVVSNDPCRHPPPRSVVLRVLFRVTSNSKRFAFVRPLPLLTV